MTASLKGKLNIDFTSSLMGESTDLSKALSQETKTDSYKLKDSPTNVELFKQKSDFSAIKDATLLGLNKTLSLLTRAENAIKELDTINDSLITLTKRAQANNLSKTERETINQEAQSLAAQYSDIALNTEYNDVKLLNKDFAGVSVVATDSVDSIISGLLGGETSSRDFESATQVSSEADVYGIISGDFNGDGNQDYATTDASVSNELHVYLGDGSGGFTKSDTVSTGSGPRVLETGDFNDDGVLDIVSANYNDGDSFSVYLGNGDGTFGAGTEFAAGDFTQGITVADFDGDGRSDVATANFNDGTISVFIADGSGNFEAATAYTADPSVYSVKSGDFNGDGVVDLATSSTGASDSVSIFLGNGDGTFGTAVSYAVGDDAFNLDVGDLNNDGVDDIVTTNYTDNSFSVLMGNGDGTFQTSVSYSAPANANGVKISDLDGDGNQDLAFVTFTSSALVVNYGNGDGTFETAQTYANDGGSVDLVINDFNNDGVKDIISSNVTDNTATLFLGKKTTGTSLLQEFDLSTEVGANQALSKFNLKKDDLNQQITAIESLKSRVDIGGDLRVDLAATEVKKVYDSGKALSEAFQLKDFIIANRALAFNAQASNLKAVNVFELLA